MSFQRKICEFVHGGGRIIATYLTAYVGQSNLCHLGGFPGSDYVKRLEFGMKLIIYTTLIEFLLVQYFWGCS